VKKSQLPFSFSRKKKRKFGLRKVMREAERIVAAQLVIRMKILGDNEISKP
jgi:hypothetical protein